MPGPLIRVAGERAVPAVLALAISVAACAADDAPHVPAQDLAEAGASDEEIVAILAPRSEEGPGGELRWRWREGRSSFRGTGAVSGLGGGFARGSNGSSRGGLEFRRGSWRLVVGGWRATGAGGLLAAGAARVRTPSAAMRPANGSFRAGGDVSSWRMQPVSGVLLRREGKGLRCAVGDGRTDAADVRLLALGAGRGRWSADVLALERHGRLETAWGATWREGGLEVWAAGARDDVGQTGLGAAQGGCGVRRGRWRAELAWADVAVGFSPGDGGRNPLVPGDWGGGWALRMTWRDAGAWRLAGLWSSGSAKEFERGPDEVACRRLWDLRLGWRPAAGIAAHARWRLRSSWRHGWDEASAWEPPTVNGRRRDETAALGVDVQEGSRSWGLDLRGRLRDDGSLSRSRWRLRLVCSAPGIGGGRWRLSSAAAWGDGLDLITVDPVVRGEMLIRHWGRIRTLGAAGWSGAVAALELKVAVWRVTRTGEGADETGLLLSAVLGRDGRRSGF